MITVVRYFWFADRGQYLIRHVNCLIWKTAIAEYSDSHFYGAFIDDTHKITVLIKIWFYFMLKCSCGWVISHRMSVHQWVLYLRHSAHMKTSWVSTRKLSAVLHGAILPLQTLPNSVNEQFGIHTSILIFSHKKQISQLVTLRLAIFLKLPTTNTISMVPRPFQKPH